MISFIFIVHWSEEMAEESDTLTISEQLRLAKDMGYSDEDIMQAISMNCVKDGVIYTGFSSFIFQKLMIKKKV